MKPTYCKRSHNLICTQLAIKNKILFRIIDETVQKMNSSAAKISAKTIGWQEKNMQKISAAKMELSWVQPQTVWHENSKVKFILAKNPMAENLTANRQTSEILSLKNLPLQLYLKNVFAKNHVKSITYEIFSKKSEELNRANWIKSDLWKSDGWRFLKELWDCMALKSLTEKITLKIMTTRILIAKIR